MNLEISSHEYTSEPETKIENKSEKKNNISIKSIHVHGDKFVINEEHYSPEMQFSGEYPANKLPGVYVDGMQYYDLKNIGFINNTGMARLIDLLKSLLVHGVEVQFVNVNTNIKNKIISMGLDHILNCF